jgi:hypothetical protein
MNGAENPLRPPGGARSLFHEPGVEMPVALGKTIACGRCSLFEGVASGAADGYARWGTAGATSCTSVPFRQQ